MSDALKAATEALERQLESTRDHGSLTWSEADWMLDAHGDDILAALRDREQDIAAAREQVERWDSPEGRTHYDAAHAVAIKDAERAVVEAAKAWRDGQSDVDDVRFGTQQDLGDAVDALRKVEGESP